MKEKQGLTLEQKLAVLKSTGEFGIKEAAKHIRVHYTTVYEWRKRLEAFGGEGFLADRPKSSGREIIKISQEKEQGILENWNRYPGFGPSRIRNQLRRQGINMSSRLVARKIQANGCGEIRNRQDGEKAGQPLELAQIDILEFFTCKQKVYLIILLDDFSRFITGWRFVLKTSIDEIIAVVREAIALFRNPIFPTFLLLNNR